MTEVARLSRNSKGRGDAVTEDALLAGWLFVAPKVRSEMWELRFFKLRSGSLTSYACPSKLVVPVSDRTTVKTLAVPEASARWLRADVTVKVQVEDPALFKLAAPSFLCTPSQATELRNGLAAAAPGVTKAPRLVLCFRPDISGGAPVAVAVRVGGPSLFVFDLDDAREYTLMGLQLQATDEPAHADFPFGLLISSTLSDQMIVPLRDFLVAAQTPIIILQWMGALQSADLDPAPKAPPPRQPRSGAVPAVVTREERSSSGALLGQLVSNVVGAKGKGSFSGVSDVVSDRSNEAQKQDLAALLRAVKWDPAAPVALQDAIALPEYQQALAAFCKTLFNEENVSFCVAVLAFKAQRDARAKQAQARSIAAEFILYSGKSVVNINSQTRKRCEDILQSGVPLPEHLFKAAFDEVIAQLESDSWPKFVAALSEQHEETQLAKEDHSWDSDDSSSFEERLTSRKQRAGLSSTLKGRAGSLDLPLSNSFGNDFGEEAAASASSETEQLEKIRALIAAQPSLDPKDPPSLKFLLAKRDLRKIMQLFAKTILAEENVMFWELVQRYRAAETVEDRKGHLKTLFEDFIPANSKTMVNIAGSERNRLMKLYGEKGVGLAESKDVFDAALTECIKVMELDLYPKFVNLLKEGPPPSGKVTPRNRKVPPLWEILNDADELDSLLVFAAGNNQQDDILFWCLVQRFRVEMDEETRFKLGAYLMTSYVSANAPRMIRVDKAKKAACAERFAELTASGPRPDLPPDLYDALWREVQSSMNKHLHPAYEKYCRKPKKTVLQTSSSSNMLANEFTSALRQREEEERSGAGGAKWVAIKSSIPSAAAAGPGGVAEGGSPVAQAKSAPTKAVSLGGRRKKSSSNFAEGQE